jgi:hypothetical protein
MLSNTVEPSTLLLLLLLPSCALQLRKAASCVAAGWPPVRNSAHHPATEEEQHHQHQATQRCSCWTVSRHAPVAVQPRVPGSALKAMIHLSINIDC